MAPILMERSLSLERSNIANSSSRRRHHVHSRPTEPRPLRRLQVEYHQQPIRVSQPRQTQWSTPSPAPMMTTPPPNMGSPLPLEIAHSITMERTPSGNSIMSSQPYESQHPHTHSPSNNTLNHHAADADAARRVALHFQRLRWDRKHERILRKLIRRDDPLDNSSIDDDALSSIVNSANAIFFSGVLTGRVQWEWSSQARYHNELIGTTALRPRANGDGFETLIVLSEPILKDPKYDRRLLLSAFLHELIHCYLFILCGFAAKRDRGHTKGFHDIAAIIDGWVGEGHLSLCNMKANLNHFRKDGGVGMDMGGGVSLGGGALAFGDRIGKDVMDHRVEMVDPRFEMVEQREVLDFRTEMLDPRFEMVEQREILDFRTEMLDPRNMLVDPRDEIRVIRGMRLGHGHVHGHEGCNQSPRPGSWPVDLGPELRGQGYY